MKNRTDKEANALRAVQLFAGDAPGLDHEIRCAEGDAPPTELRLFPMGSFETSKGTFTYDGESAKQILAERAKRKTIDLVSDYEHQSLAVPPVKAPASGWYDIEARDDGMYAVNIRWTPVALEHFKNKEYRYFSQAFDVDKTGRVCTFKNFALTNMPANYDIPALVAASENAPAAGVLSLADGADPIAILKTINPELFDLASKVTPETNPPAWAKDSATWAHAKKAAEKYQGESFFYPLVAYIYENMGGAISRPKKTTAPAATTSAVSAKEGSNMEEIKKALADLIAALNAEESSEEEQMKKLTATLATLGFAPKVQAAEPTKCAACGMSPCACAAEPMATALRQAISLTDRKDPIEALGVIRSWKEAHTRAIELSAKVAKFERDAFTSSFDAAVKEGVDGKKISPALVDNWIPMLREQGAAGLVQLRAFLGNSAPIVGTETREPSVDSITLTQEERTMIKLNKLDEKAYLEHKRAKSISLVAK